MSIPLQQLDNAHVIVEMSLPGRQLVLDGKGRYETRAEGNRLHVRVDDPDAPFTIVLDENAWTGQITMELDGSYRLSLAAP
jgi:hypothetical protein